MSDSSITEHQFSICRYCDVVFLVEILILFVEVDELSSGLTEQLEIILTSLDIAVFPEPILSNADVVQRVVDFVDA